MKQFWLLLKSQLKGDYGPGSRLVYGKKAGGSRVGKGLLYGLLLLLMVGSFFIMAMGMMQPLMPQGLAGVILLLGYIAAFALVLFRRIFTTHTELFICKDYDILFSLPLRPSAILGAKVVVSLLTDYLLCAVLLLPFIAAYIVLAGVTVWGVLCGLLLLVLTPLLPATLASLIAVLLGGITSRFRKHKMLQTVLGVVATAAYLVLFYSIDWTALLTDSVLAQNLNAGIGQYFPPAANFAGALVTGNPLTLLAFAAWSVLPFVAFLLLFSRMFGKLRLRFAESGGGHKAVVLSENRAATAKKALFQLERKRYLGLPMYVLNTCIGMVLAVGGSIYILFAGGKLLQTVFPGGEGLSLPLIAVLFLCLCVGMSTPVSSSISLEGNRLWLKRSLPVSTWDIFAAKLKLNLWVQLPAAWLAGGLLCIGLHLEGFDILWIFLLPTLFSAVTTLGGLYINLKNPKLAWSSETIVVKQSTSVMLSLLLGMGVPLLLGVLCLLLPDLSYHIVFAGMAALCVILLPILWRWLHRCGVRRFEAL